MRPSICWKHTFRTLPGFLAEGVREAAKPAYGPQVGEMMQERLAKWTASR